MGRAREVSESSTWPTLLASGLGSSQGAVAAASVSPCRASTATPDQQLASAILLRRIHRDSPCQACHHGVQPDDAGPAVILSRTWSPAAVRLDMARRSTHAYDDKVSYEKGVSEWIAIHRSSQCPLSGTVSVILRPGWGEGGGLVRAGAGSFRLHRLHPHCRLRHHSRWDRNRHSYMRDGAVES